MKNVDSDEPRIGQIPLNVHPADPHRDATCVRTGRLPCGEHQPASRAQNPETFCGRRTHRAGEVDRVDAQHRLRHPVRKTGLDQIAALEPSLLLQPELLGPGLRGLLRRGGEVKYLSGALLTP